MTETRTLWKASPSKILLFPQLMMLIPLLLLFILSMCTYYNISIPEIGYTKADNLVSSIQNFLHKYDIAHFPIWAAMGFHLFILLKRYLKIRFENYTLTSEALHFNTGVLNRSIDETKLFRIIDTGIDLPIWLRLFNRGHIAIYSNDPSNEASGFIPSITTDDGRKGVFLAAVKDPLKVKSIIDEQVNRVRRERSVATTELM